MKKRIFYTLLTSIGILLLVVILEACTKWTRYVIEAGDHSCEKISKQLMGVDVIDFSFRTNNTWYYYETKSQGWNKIRGFSHGHYQNNSSARLTYKCIDDTLLIVGAYCYVNGISPQQNARQKIILDTISTNNEYHCRIIREDGMYKFYFEDKYWDCPAGEELSWGYKLNPYIGGSFTLRHDWMVDIYDN